MALMRAREVCKGLGVSVSLLALLGWFDLVLPKASVAFDLRGYCNLQASRRSEGDPIRQRQESDACYGQISSYAREQRLSHDQAAAQVRQGLVLCGMELGGMSRALRPRLTISLWAGMESVIDLPSFFQCLA